jgi:hypothetical protein
MEQISNMIQKYTVERGVSDIRLKSFGTSTPTDKVGDFAGLVFHYLADCDKWAISSITSC